MAKNKGLIGGLPIVARLAIIGGILYWASKNVTGSFLPIPRFPRIGEAQIATALPLVQPAQEEVEEEDEYDGLL